MHMRFFNIIRFNSARSEEDIKFKITKKSRKKEKEKKKSKHGNLNVMKGERDVSRAEMGRAFGGEWSPN